MARLDEVKELEVIEEVKQVEVAVNWAVYVGKYAELIEKRAEVV